MGTYNLFGGREGGVASIYGAYFLSDYIRPLTLIWRISSMVTELNIKELVIIRIQPN